MNELNFNETFSYLKISCLMLNKELSIMKEKNSYLNQKLNELISIISSINQRIITKEEMKEIIKEGLSVFTPTPTGKVITNTQTQVNDEIIEQKKEQIKKIEEVIRSEELDSNKYGGVLSLVETEDKRIASGGYDGNISISSYKLNEKKWKRDIYKQKAHNNRVTSLCNLNGNRLLSGSDDRSIKVWKISDADIALLKDIQIHTSLVRKVIPLSQERFASCSEDKTVRIWKDDNSYECLSTLKHNGSVVSILQLKDKEVLVSCGYYPSTGVSLWNINNYTQQNIIKGFGVNWSTRMIELFDGNIALSSGDKPCLIIIIDSSSFQLKKKILIKEYISNCSSLCMFNDNSFIYVYEGTFLQISSEEYSILFQMKDGNFDGEYGIIPIEGGKYFAIENGKCISIVKLCYA